MIKCEVIEKFDLKDFGKLKNIQRKAADIKGSLFVGDTFECDKEMADYLLGNNALNKTVVKVIEVLGNSKVEFNKDKITLNADEINLTEEATNAYLDDKPIKSKKKKKSKE